LELGNEDEQYVEREKKKEGLEFSDENDLQIKKERKCLELNNEGKGDGDKGSKVDQQMQLGQRERKKVWNYKKTKCTSRTFFLSLLTLFYALPLSFNSKPFFALYCLHHSIDYK
jgi:hypothetical protein